MCCTLRRQEKEISFVGSSLFQYKDIPLLSIPNDLWVKRVHFVVLVFGKFYCQNFYEILHGYHDQKVAAQTGHHSMAHDNKALLYAEMNNYAMNMLCYVATVA